MKCLSCNTNEAGYHPQIGYIPCEECVQRHIDKRIKTIHNIEFTTEDIKEQRKAYKGDIRQPFRHGEVSKEYLDEQKAKGRPHNLDITPEEEANARNVWDIEEKRI